MKVYKYVIDNSVKGIKVLTKNAEYHIPVWDWSKYNHGNSYTQFFNDNLNAVIECSEKDLVNKYNVEYNVFCFISFNGETQGIGAIPGATKLNSEIRCYYGGENYKII